MRKRDGSDAEALGEGRSNPEFANQTRFSTCKLLIYLNLGVIGFREKPSKTAENRQKPSPTSRNRRQFREGPDAWRRSAKVSIVSATPTPTTNTACEVSVE
jgi:hypothetical protein